MSVVPHDANQPQSGSEENAQPSPSVQETGNARILSAASGHRRGASGKAEPANAAELEAVRSQVAERIAGLADKTADLTKQATSSAVAASKVGLAKAAKIGRENVLRS